MRKTVMTMVLVLFSVAGLSAADNGFFFGLHADAGARYDDLRMCVASPAGVKGGPIMEIYVDLGFGIGEKGKLIVSFPVMRPVLFGAAFQMMQVEPLVNYQYTFETGGNVRPVVGGGLGISLHYGPDYRSDRDNRGEDFFAAGPIFNLYGGLELKKWTFGVRTFYVPLFSADHGTGTVIGGTLLVYYRFGK